MSDPTHSRGGLVIPLLRIAGPVALARLGIMCMGVVDTIIVGQLAPRQLPFLALGWAPTGVLIVAGIGLLIGVQVLAARVIGEGSPSHAGTIWRKGMVVAVVTGAAAALCLFFGAAPLLRVLGVAPDLIDGSAAVARVLALSIPLHFIYVVCSYFLEAIQRPNAGMLVIWAANVINVAMAVTLTPIYGAVGAAWGTVGGRAFTVVALITWILLAKSSRAYDVKRTLANAPSYAALLAVGAAAALSQVAEAGAFSGMTVIAGRIGADAVAGYQILLNMLSVVFMVALGMSSGTAVLVADATGRRDARGVAHAGWTGMAVNSLAMAAAALLIVVFAAPIAHTFTADLALAAVLITVMPLTALIPLPDGGQSVCSSALRARGDNWFPTASHILAYVFVMPPLGFFLGEINGWGVRGLMTAILLASVLSVSVLVARFALLSRRRSLDA
ncbi:MAG TPA: MATE family efflux transporter [Caulobacterales bacterium]|nr:MATE family efflux transporter [Caulobacterales bacterium]